MRQESLKFSKYFFLCSITINLQRLRHFNSTWIYKLNFCIFIYALVFLNTWLQRFRHQQLTHLSYHTHILLYIWKLLFSQTSYSPLGPTSCGNFYNVHPIQANQRQQTATILETEKHRKNVFNARKNNVIIAVKQDTVILRCAIHRMRNVYI